MMLFLEEFEAWVTIDGQHAEEYQWQYIPKQKLVQCWIASEVGKPFQIHWLDSKRSTATDGFVLLDGKKCGGSVISSDLDKPNYTCKEYIRTGPTTVKPFEFSQISLTDDDTRADPDLLTTELGQIELLIVRVRVKSYETSQTRGASKQQLLHEKAKKGIQHQTTFGKTVASTPRQAVRLEQISDDAVARFRFLYRPIDMLKAKGIVSPDKPRAQTATGPESKLHVVAGTRFSVKTEDALSKYAINSAPSRSISISDWDILLPSSEVDIKPEAQDEMDVIKVQGSASSVPGPSSLPGLVSLPEGLRSTLGPGSFVPSTGYISSSAGLELPSLCGFFKCDDDGLKEQNMTETEILAPDDDELETVVVHQNLQGTASDEICEPSVQLCTVVSTAGMTAMNPIVIADDDNDGVKTENSNHSSIRAASSFSFATSATSLPVSPSPFPSDRAPMIDTRSPVISALELLGHCKKRKRSSTPSTIHVSQQKWCRAESNPSNDTQEVKGNNSADDTRHSTTSVSTEPPQAPKIDIVKSDDGALDSTQITDADDDEEDRMLASEMETLQTRLRILQAQRIERRQANLNRRLVDNQRKEGCSHAVVKQDDTLKEEGMI
ncbi:hypothetical protein F5051DRAFT_395342 [Lentinula edodes]|nr:hypothetical protein F5051DRAFT_395342 [Lentinula edodes]